MAKLVTEIMAGMVIALILVQGFGLVLFTLESAANWVIGFTSYAQEYDTCIHKMTPGRMLSSRSYDLIQDFCPTRPYIDLL